MNIKTWVNNMCGGHTVAESYNSQVEYWTRVGRRVLAELPEHERQPFYLWVRAGHLHLYESSPGDALIAWRKSAAWYSL